MMKLTQERLTQEANQRLEQYLRQVRTALRGCRSVSSEDVERDIREHVDSELPAEEGAVSVHDLDAILKRLGSPSQWVPPEEISWRRRFLMRIRTGPEDWRLAYLAFGLLVVGVLLLPIFWVFIAASYLAARASLAAARERQEHLVAQKWFIYPTLVIVNTALLFAVVAGPPFMAAAGASVFHEYHTRSAGEQLPDFGFLPKNQVEFTVAVAVAVAAMWWTVVGCVTAIWPGLVQAVLAGPIGEGFGRKHARALMYVGLGLGILWGAWIAVSGYHGR
jgi:hypothetical protein